MEKNYNAIFSLECKCHADFARYVSRDARSKLNTVSTRRLGSYLATRARRKARVKMAEKTENSKSSPWSSRRIELPLYSLPLGPLEAARNPIGWQDRRGSRLR